jgi:hypothetical protein
LAEPVEPDVDDLEDVVKEEAELKEKKPALTIVIQSWATPIAALVMLIAGLAGGFFLRPVVLPERQLVTEVVNLSQPTSVPAAVPSANPDAAEVMQVVSQQTRHFAGDEEALVTIIEFSDFQ